MHKKILDPKEKKAAGKPAPPESGKSDRGMTGLQKDKSFALARTISFALLKGRSFALPKDKSFGPPDISVTPIEKNSQNLFREIVRSHTRDKKLPISSAQFQPAASNPSFQNELKDDKFYQGMVRMLETGYGFDFSSKEAQMERDRIYKELVEDIPKQKIEAVSKLLERGDSEEMDTEIPQLITELTDKFIVKVEEEATALRQQTASRKTLGGGET